MNENIENIVKIDTPSFQDMCKRIIQLEEENAQLKADNNVLGKELTYSKERCVDLEDKVRDLKKQYDDFYEKDYVKRIDECNQLFGELQDIKSMSMFEFASKYCKDEQLEADGKAFARELLGGA